MKRRVRLIRTLVIGMLVAPAALLLAPRRAEAGGGLQSVIQNMFADSATGSPTAFSTQDRFGYSAGYLAVRAPIQNFNLLSFAPPNISGGCGGINLFLGSFSFINAQEFTALITDIGQNAISYAFIEAIGYECPKCMSDLAWIQNEMEKMNSLMKNSCQLAQGLVSYLPGLNPNAGSLASAAEGMWQSVDGTVSSAFSSFENQFVDPNTANETAQASSPTTPAAAPDLINNPLIGNMTWKGLQDTGAINELAGFTATPTIAEEMMMSVLGTVIIHPTIGTTGAANCTAGVAQCSPQRYTLRPSLNINDLVNGPSGSTSGQGGGGAVMQCEAWSGEGSSGTTVSYPAFPVGGLPTPDTCFAVEKGSLTTVDPSFIGIKAQVQDELFGGGGYTGLVNYVTSGTPPSPSSKAAAFISITPVPIFTDMLNVQHEPGMVNLIASQLEPLIVADYALNLTNALRSTAEDVFDGSKNTTPPPWLGGVMRQLQATSHYYGARALKLIRQQQGIDAVISAASATMNPPSR
ncbi:MAG: conjugal transfer protein TraH [Acidiphilium sp.]|nr:conjugal transfer protein TraH [Acidiphilium sp.]